MWGRPSRPKGPFGVVIWSNNQSKRKQWTSTWTSKRSKWTSPSWPERQYIDGLDRTRARSKTRSMRSSRCR